MASNQIQNLSKKLENLGLSEKESLVYVASLFLGASSVQKIAKQADINRPTAYVILEQLEEKGLVSESNEVKKTIYIPESPDALLSWLQKQEKELENKKNEFKDMVSELEKTHRDTVPKAPQVRFYKGLEGINTILAESFRKEQPNTEIYGLVNYEEVKKFSPDHLKKAPQQRVKKKISSKVLYWLKDKELPSNSKLLRETKKLNSPPKADITLFQNRATLLSYAGKDSVGIVIESKEIVDALRQLFELAWKNNKDS